MYFMDKKILVVGSNGYLGSNLAQRLIDKGFFVKLADLAINSFLESEFYTQIDFSNIGRIKAILSDIDVVFFFAGRTGDSELGFNQADQYIISNEVTLVNLLNVIKDFKKKPKVVFPSTRLIYQGSNLPLNENSELDPKSVYSVNKLACEKYLKIFSNCYGIDYTIFRISLPYGSLVYQERISYGVMSYLVSLAQQKQTLNIFGKGNQIGSLIHIDDLVEILIRGGIHEESNGEIYNVGGPDHLEMGKVVELIARTFEAPVQKVVWPEISRKTDQGNLIFDSSKILTLLNFSYKYNFIEWLNQVKQ
jgi:UDP-glucose 4-epimerase